MDVILPIETFSLVGRFIVAALLAAATLLTVSGAGNLFARQKTYWEQPTTALMKATSLILVAGFLWICWLHYLIYQRISLELPTEMLSWLNNQLSTMNNRSAYGLPLYDPVSPPRYAVPVWIENEKYYFWFMCYSLMALVAHMRINNRRFRALLHLLLAIQLFIIPFAANPFAEPLPRFFAEITPWFETSSSAMQRMGLFMGLYPKMVFYYNAHYMWLHPPLLFIAYAGITITFAASAFMLFQRDLAIETIAYDAAKLGYFMLTLGMLLGYPWALQAWGPNWWWDPKICSSIMMWVIYSTYLHTRLYANKTMMWYFSAGLGILCFAAMIFTFAVSFFFPGEHTFQ